jgi:hypothetical protein
MNKISVTKYVALFFELEQKILLRLWRELEPGASCAQSIRNWKHALVGGNIVSYSFLHCIMRSYVYANIRMLWFMLKKTQKWMIICFFITFICYRQHNHEHSYVEMNDRRWRFDRRPTIHMAISSTPWDYRWQVDMTRTSCHCKDTSEVTWVRWLPHTHTMHADLDNMESHVITHVFVGSTEKSTLDSLWT